jgi:V/A-type H+/Na+-transporting ATPase subunit K
MKRVLSIVMLLLVVSAWASVAHAQQPAAAAHQTEAPAAPAPQSGIDYKAIFKALGAALAIGFSAFGTAWAQSKIGAAAAGALAEKPEISGSMIILEALPETIIILGFVIALLIIVLI